MKYYFHFILKTLFWKVYFYPYGVIGGIGAPRATRTPDLRIRSPIWAFFITP